MLNKRSHKIKINKRKVLTSIQIINIFRKMELLTLLQLHQGIQMLLLRKRKKMKRFKKLYQRKLKLKKEQTNSETLLLSKKINHLVRVIILKNHLMIKLKILYLERDPKIQISVLITLNLNFHQEQLQGLKSKSKWKQIELKWHHTPKKEANRKRLKKQNFLRRSGV